MRYEFAATRLMLWILAIVIAGCNQPFNPKGPFEEQLVVYSILSSARDVQFVRVFTNYDAQGFDPFQNTIDRLITGAQVVLTGPDGTYSFKDTLLPRSDTSRYKSEIAAYAVPIRVQPGQTYSLVVNSGRLGSTSATITVPGKARIDIYPGAYILNEPWDTTMNRIINLVATVSPLTKGHYGRMLIEYAVLADSVWKEERVEVPTRISDSDFRMAEYPALELARYHTASVAYLKSAYVATLNKVYIQYTGTKLVFKRVVLQFLQVEHNLYDYYNIVHGFQDPISIRIDEPDYHNLSNGYGVFGAGTLDSLVHHYPDNFPLNRK
jgi:hypothetical protein